MTIESEPESIIKFRSWFSSNGGKIHPDVTFKQVPSGFSVYASSDVPSDMQIVSCPYSLAITPDVSKAALSTLLKSPAGLDAWTERQLICSYIGLHWILGEDGSISSMLPQNHQPYLEILPSPDKLTTPLHFSQSELGSFVGSNLYGATTDRKRDWEKEWNDCKSLIGTANEKWGAGLTWERYLTASTYISSRAFPSSIRYPDNKSADASYPILLPGVDSLNHQRGAAVSWVTSSSPVPEIALVLHNPNSAGSELFNNYGPKPNSELILGYGFAIKENPSDTIVLQIGVGGLAAKSTAPLIERKKLEVGRDGAGAEAVWDEIMLLVTSYASGKSEGGSEETSGYEDQLEGAGMLGDMVIALLDRLPRQGIIPEDLRSDIRQMLEWYLEGQRSILESLLVFARDKEQVAIEIARTQGVELVFDGDSDEEDEFDEDSEDDDEGRLEDAAE